MNYCTSFHLFYLKGDPMNIENISTEFMEYQERIKALSNAASLIHWDASTGAPKKNSKNRAKMLGILSSEIYTLFTSDKMKKYIVILEEYEEQISHITMALVKYCKKEYEKLIKIPKKDYQAYAELCANSLDAWESAKSSSNFKIFSSFLEKIVEYTHKFIEYRDFKNHPYNTLIDDYEPDMTVEKLDLFFKEIKSKIVPLVQKITNEGKVIHKDFLFENYPINKQEEFSIYILNKIGYDFDSGMLKESTHPFTLGFSPNDVRITTHYYPNNIMSAIFSSIHEGGHAIYEQNVSKKLSTTLLSEGASMGIHESQSRFYENLLGRSLSFWKYFYQKLSELFPIQLKNISIDEFYKAINYSEPSLIRIEADELTYSLHILIRYEIEKALIEKKVKVYELPELWNHKYKEYLGLSSTNDSEGILQDIHWADGSFGYFPSYALGNAYAAQFKNMMSKEINIDKNLENGNFSKINTWLKKNIHQYGKLLTPNQIIKNVTGEDLNPIYFTDYLEEKYNDIYLN